MARCRARTENGTGPLCQRKVKREGDRCYDHRGLPTAPPRITRSKTKPVARQQRPQRQPTRSQLARREQQNHERVKKAAEYCADVLTKDWEEAVAKRASDYVSEQTWKSLFRSHRRNCKSLAKIAKEVLAAKDKFHKAIGGIVAWLLSLVGIRESARVFARELASKIPIPAVDAKAVAVARGVQITGIVICVSAGNDLTRCQCFIDLALTETKTRVKKILIAATHDWANKEFFSDGRGH